MLAAKTFRRPRLVSVALVASVLVAASCTREPPAKPTADSSAPADAAAPAAAAEPAYGDAILLGSIGDASNLIPMLAGDSASHQIAAYLFDGLVSYDKTLSHLEPRLAKSWDVSEDGLEIVFHLRDDVHWTDGTPFTARDVEFGFNTIRDPNTLTAYSEDYRQVAEFEVVDDHTVRVRYDEPFAPALSSWGSMVVLPRHLLEGQNINEAEFGRAPVGLGSHKLVKWESNTRIELEANRDYYRGRPYVERVVYRIIPDLSTQFLELKAGGIDMMGLTPLQYARQTSGASFERDFAKYDYIGNNYTYMGYNLRRPMFQDVRVRRAFAHAIDKDELVQGVLLGLGIPAVSPYKPGTDWAHPELDAYACLLYTSPSPRDRSLARMPSSA